MDVEGQHAVDGEQSFGASPPPIASRFVLLAVVLAMTAFTSSVRVVTCIRDRQGQPRMQIQRTPNIGHRECGARLTGVNEAALCEKTFSLEEFSTYASRSTTLTVKREACGCYSEAVAS